MVTVEQAPRREVLDLIAGQARLRFELDDKTIAKAEINLGQPMTMKAPKSRPATRWPKCWADRPELSRHREGKLFITTAARLAEDTDKKGQVIEGPPVKLVMSQPRKASDPSYREHDPRRHGTAAGRPGAARGLVKFVLDEYGKELFEPKELVVLVHLSRPAIDEAVVLDVFPPPKKLVRTATVVVHGVDPRLQDRARSLVKQLGDRSPQARESAETRLFEMGPVAVPVLEDALSNKDVEIVFRAERLLLKLGRAVP